MARGALEYRRAGQADLEGQYEVFVAAQSDLWGRHGLEWTASRFEVWSAPHRHLLAEDGERSFVAVDGERVVAFSAAFVREDAWYFSALFVAPAYQGSGIGRELLDRSWDNGPTRRITITDSFQPASNGLYAQRGLIPTTPIRALVGTAKGGPPPRLEGAVPEPDALAAIDRAAYEFDRSADHRYWSKHAAEARLWLRSGEPVAYSYVTEQGLIGPLAGRDDESAALALQAELAGREGQQTTMFVPGTARTLVAAALAGGLRFGRPPGLLLLNDRCQPPQALAISGYWLF